LTVGSGQFGTRWERMHREKFSMALSTCGISAAGNSSSVPAGSRCAQVFSAALSWELPTPSCCALGNFPLPYGSGKFDTPRDRTQLAKGSIWEFVDWEFVDPPAVDEPPELVDDALPSHAAASRTRLAVAMMMGLARSDQPDAADNRS
jgi:hypothetical protein